MRDWRRWSPAVAFAVLAGGWYVANLYAFAAVRRTQSEANAKIVATGHRPVFTDIPSVWTWSHELRPALFGMAGAALIAVLLRRASRWPLFLLAGAVPIAVNGSEHLHGRWAPGTGIDLWTSGAGVGIPGLDLSRFHAGPFWAVAAGTALTVAAVLVPALLMRPTAELMHPARRFVQTLPYDALLAVGTALAVGELKIDDTGGGAGRNMLVGGAAAGLIAIVVFATTGSGRYWRDTGLAAIAVGLVAVAGLNPGAMTRTKLAAFAAAVGIALIAAAIARRPRLGRPVPSLTPLPPAQ